jgi:methylthioribulose-1-phosphate dehydratase
MTDPYRNKLNELAEIKREFSSRGWMPATSGNFSLRVKEKPLEFFVSVSGRDKSATLPDDFILVNEEGKPVSPSGKGESRNLLKPSAEVGVHAQIYKKLFPAAVLHVHTLYNTLVSVHSPYPEALLIEGLEMIKGLGLWEEKSRVKIPIVPNHHDLTQLASAAGDAADRSAPGILIKGHGLYAWGNSLHEAKRNVEAFEFLFQYLFLEGLMKRL